MTKNILIFPLLACTVMHSMETNSLLEITKKSFCITYCGTNIHVTKESISSAANKAEYTIVGSKQQELLSGKFDVPVETIWEPRPVGRIWNQGWSCACLYEKNKNDDSDSDDDTYKPYPYSPKDEKKKLWQGIYQETTSSVKNVVEPCINQSDEGFIYYVWRNDPNYGINDERIFLTFKGNEAIKEASKDLELCYKIILKLTAGYRGEPNAYMRPFLTKNISAVFPALSVDVGFPRDIAAPIAIAAIFDFFQNYPEGYDNITLVVKKRSDFARYKLLLMQHTGLLQNICLFILAHKHDNNIVSQLPQDVVHYITQLI